MSSLYNQHRQGSQLTENPFSRGSKEVGRNAFLYDSSPPPQTPLGQRDRKTHYKNPYLLNHISIKDTAVIGKIVCVCARACQSIQYTVRNSL